MSEERKAKAAARRAARKQNKSERVEQNPLIATEPELNIDYTIEKPAELGIGYAKNPRPEWAWISFQLAIKPSPEPGFWW